MQVFISSLIAGMEPNRKAARDAVTTLRHQPLMAEEFGAQPNSPQVACLAGVRQSDIVVLILGDRYGVLQRSGLSPTHEEYREAQGRKPVIAFVQNAINPEPRQAAFIAEVQNWEGGLFRGAFSGPSDLQISITRALHDYELANTVGPVDEDDILARVLNSLPAAQRGYHSGTPSLTIAIAGGPSQSILRPIEIENPNLADTLHKEAMFGESRLFDHSKGSERTIDGRTLVLTQGRDGAQISLDEQGTISIRLNINQAGRGYLPVLIQETVQHQLVAAVTYAAWVLEHVDPTQRLSHVVVAARISDSGLLTWRTQKENEASPNCFAVATGNAEQTPVHLSRPRASLRLDATHLVEDLIVMLRRQWKQ